MFIFSIEYIFLLIAILVYLLFLSKKKWPLLVILLIMALMGVFRGLHVGTDHAGYEEDFGLIDSYASIIYIRHRFELGYVSLILLFKKFSDDWLLFSGLTFIIPILGAYCFFRSYKTNYAWSLFLFYLLGEYFLAFNVMRQYMAIYSILAFVYLLRDGKFRMFALIVIVFAVAFHLSSLIMLFLIPIFKYYDNTRQQLNKSFCYILLLSSYVSFFIGPQFLVSLLAPLLSVLKLNEFENYIITANEDAGNAFSSLYTCYAIFLLAQKKGQSFNSETFTFVIFVVLFNLFNMFYSQSSRTALPFRPFLFVLIPFLIYSKSLRNVRLFSLVTILFCVIYFVFSFVVRNSGGINPYYTWWGEPD